MDELRTLMEKYRETFGDIFPRMEMMSATDEEVVTAIGRCLDTGQPFDSGLPDNVDI